jgi:peptidoglycan/LPS O-acetylase OafA/YrhL
MVVVFHSTFYATPQDGGFNRSDPFAWAVAAAGRMWAGVPIFFVISGYCISATADSSRRKGLPIGTYFVRRFRRIFPPYWACLAATAVAVAAGEWFVPGLFDDDNHGMTPPWRYGAWHWLGNLTLTEGWRPHVVGPPHPPFWPFFLGQAWTLGYEEQFYAVVGLILAAFPRHFFASALVVTTAAVIAEKALLRSGVSTNGFFISGFAWVQFATGVAVYYAVNYAGRAGRMLTAGVLLAGVAYCSRDAGELLRTYPGPRAFNFVAASFASAALLLHPLDARAAATPLLAPLRACGMMCYSLYLVHWPVCKAVSHLLYLHGVRSDRATVLLTVPVCILASVVAGWVFFVVVERRFLNSARPPCSPPG